MANKQPDYGVRPCCVPGCSTRLPRTQELPVCRECGIKIAVAHMWDAERLHAVTAERMRRIEAHRARVRAGQTRTSRVYYLDMGDCIKIGFSTNLPERLRGLRRGYADVLATEPGGRALEGERHLQFASDRLGRRENFRKSDALVAHIEQVNQEHPLPIEWISKRVTVRKIDRPA